MNQLYRIPTLASRSAHPVPVAVGENPVPETLAHCEARRQTASARPIPTAAAASSPPHPLAAAGHERVPATAYPVIQAAHRGKLASCRDRLTHVFYR